MWSSVCKTGAGGASRNDCRSIWSFYSWWKFGGNRCQVCTFSGNYNTAIICIFTLRIIWVQIHLLGLFQGPWSPFIFFHGRGLDIIPRLLVSSRPSYVRSYLCVSYILSNVLKVEREALRLKKLRWLLEKRTQSWEFWLQELMRLEIYFDRLMQLRCRKWVPYKLHIVFLVVIC